MSSVKDVDANEKELLEDSEGTDLRENKNNEQDTSPDFDEVWLSMFMESPLCSLRTIYFCSWLGKLIFFGFTVNIFLL